MPSPALCPGRCPGLGAALPAGLGSPCAHWGELLLTPPWGLSCSPSPFPLLPQSARGALKSRDNPQLHPSWALGGAHRGSHFLWEFQGHSRAGALGEAPFCPNPHSVLRAGVGWKPWQLEKEKGRHCWTGWAVWESPQCLLC